MNTKRSSTTFLCICVMLVSIMLSVSLDLNPRGLYASGTDGSSGSNENIVTYAMKWCGNTKIPYVYGGPGRGKTLEEMESGGLGVDCSGFVYAVYKHFGITIPMSSSSMQSGAKKVFYQESEAIPGDVCWWSGHVAIYIGDGKIVHTNTSTPPNNYIHVTALADYRAPSAFLRMVDDSSVLNSDGSVNTEGAFGNTTSDEVTTTVTSAVSTGSLVTESDLTGLVLDWSIQDAQQNIELKSREDLSISERDSVDGIKDGIEGTKKTYTQTIRFILKLIGYLVMLYGVFLGLGYLFDMSNNFIDISMLNILSFGHWNILMDEDQITEEKSKDKKTKNKVFLTKTGILVRVIVVECIGTLIVSGYLLELISNIMRKF